MKYTEFEVKVKEINNTWEIANLVTLIVVKSELGMTICCVAKSSKFGVDTLYRAHTELVESEANMLMQLAYELAATPLEEREEPKKKYYYYRLPYVACSDGYLNYDADDHAVSYHDKTPSQTYQTQFTREEYAEIAKDHGISEGVHISEEVTQ